MPDPGRGFPAGIRFYWRNYIAGRTPSTRVVQDLNGQIKLAENRVFTVILKFENTKYNEGNYYEKTFH